MKSGHQNRQCLVCSVVYLEDEDLDYVEILRASSYLFQLNGLAMDLMEEI